jgi:pimeloyl-ACP methyl ester carboxylesterase
VLLALVLVLWNPGRRVIWAARLGLALNRLSQGDDGKNLAVLSAKVSRRDDGRTGQAGQTGRTYEALYYRPSGTAAKTAIIIAAGLSEKGCYHPQLVALARTLAAHGLLVVTPDIREFREFQISTEPISQMAFWHRQISTLEGGGDIRKIGIAGVSYSGTLAIIAASRPEIRNATSFVLAIGPYYDIPRCAREWFAAGSPAEWKGYYPTRYYARWLMMRSALDMLPTPAERRFVDETIAALLLSHRAPAVPPDLPPAAKRWHGLASVRPGHTDEGLASDIERYLATHLYGQLDPEKSLAGLRCPLFLIHGEYDDLIPPRESVELHRRVEGSHLFISPLLTHTQPVKDPLTSHQKLRAIRDVVVFGYRLAAVID